MAVFLAGGERVCVCVCVSKSVSKTQGQQTMLEVVNRWGSTIERFLKYTLKMSLERRKARWDMFDKFNEIIEWRRGGRTDHQMQNCNYQSQTKTAVQAAIDFSVRLAGGRGTHVNTSANKAGWHVVGICGLIIHTYLQSRNLGCYVLRNHWQSSYLHCWLLTRSHTYVTTWRKTETCSRSRPLVQAVDPTHAKVLVWSGA